MRQEVLRMLTLRTLGSRAAAQDKEVAIQAARLINLTVAELLHERLLIKVGLVPETTIYGDRLDGSDNVRLIATGELARRME